MDAWYWEWRIENANNKEEFDSAMNGMLSYMVDEGLICMSWDDKEEEFSFFMNKEQKASFDQSG